ncbi:MAG: hypothetical protein U5K51_14755 [Flavobacteriaceae bacterium]|nr:hypothetical protein [Flavobacteriaceae bacterium]
MKLLVLFWSLIAGFTTCLSQNLSDSIITVDGVVVSNEHLLQRYVRIPSVSETKKRQVIL